MKTFDRFLAPGLIVVVGVALWTQVNGSMDQLTGRMDQMDAVLNARIDKLDDKLSASIASLDRRLARVEGQLSVLVRPVDPPAE